MPLPNTSEMTKVYRLPNQKHFSEMIAVILNVSVYGLKQAHYYYF